MGLFKDARALISPAVIEAYFKAGDARWRGDEFYTLSPLRPDKHVKNTFSIRSDGLWKDHATGDGGDFIDLLSAAHNISKKDAAQKIVNEFGHGMESVTAPDPKNRAPKKPPVVAVVIPDDDEHRDLLRKKVTSGYATDAHGTAKKIYTYRNIADEVIMYVCRYERDDGRKELIPYYWDGKKYIAGRPRNLRIPLFNEHLLRDKTRAVIIVEGEKCAKVEVDGYTLVSWVGGAANANNIDWSVIADWPQPVYIWPDNDAEGRKAALTIKDKLPDAQILEITDRPDKWDIADAHAEGMDIAAFLRSCPVMYKDTPATPYDAFVAAIDDLYKRENIQQFDGNFFVYMPQRHYWEARAREAIEQDIQLWILQNVRQFLDESDKAVHTFVSNAKSFIRSFANQYYIENPFKYSALKPYIHVRNGCIELTQGGYIFHDRRDRDEAFFRNKYPLNVLDVDFDPSLIQSDIAKSAPLFYKYLTDIIPEHARSKQSEHDKTLQMFSQIMGYTISPIKKKPYFFAFYGKQQSGKSFFMDIMETIIPSDFVNKTPIKSMDNRFSSSSLFGAKIYCDDDYKAGANLPDDFIKTYSGEKTISIEYKNQNVMRGVRISLAMFFFSNHPLNVQGGVEGLERRLVYVPFRNTIKAPDVFMLDKMVGNYVRDDGKRYDERAAILAFALRGIMLFWANGYNFVMPDWAAVEREEWLRNSSSINQFLAEQVYDLMPGSTWRPAELYGLYKTWCTDNEKKPYGRNNFYETVRLDDRMEFTHGRDGNTFKLVGKAGADDTELMDIPL